MLLVKDVLDSLKYGDLATVFKDFPLEENYDKVINNLNIALNILCNRFSLIEKQITIRRYSHISNYKLERKYARTSTIPCPTKYILDTEEEPFKEDVIQVLFAFDEFGNQMPLNDTHNPFSWFTSRTTIQIPNTHRSGELAFFSYKAYHPKVEKPTDELLIPEILLEAVSSYIAYKIHSTRSDKESTELANNLYQKFENQCVALEQDNTLTTSTTCTNIKPQLGGWI